MDMHNKLAGLVACHDQLDTQHGFRTIIERAEMATDISSAPPESRFGHDPRTAVR